MLVQHRDSGARTVPDEGEDNRRSQQVMDDNPLSLDRPPSPRTLVLWSGGIDSTYVLWRLLRRGFAVHSLYVSIEQADVEQRTCLRARFERQAVVRLQRRMLASLTEREVQWQHLEAGVCLPAVGRQCARASALMFHAARVMAALEFTAADRLTFGVSRDNGLPIASAEFALRRLLIARQLRAAMERDDVPRLVLADPPLGKQQMFAALPQLWRGEIVSCNQPELNAVAEVSACEQCEKCRQRRGFTTLNRVDLAPISQRSATPA